jgi:hypothetical protein
MDAEDGKRDVAPVTGRLNSYRVQLARRRIPLPGAILENWEGMKAQT